ncbi:MAG TPA: hypothetical protein VNO18_06955 [Xanthobacteraceae bacterium]|nr:hypothetical protein [Xanthobacteraceae bacterium]
MAKRATKMPAAKGRPKRSSSWGTSHKEEDQDAMPLWIDGQGAAPLWLEDQGAMPLWVPDETFCEEMSEWFDSPEGELWTDMSDTLEVLLKDVRLDAGRRRFLWPEAKRLNLKQSAKRIHQQYPNFPEDKIEEFLIYWIQALYVPEGYSESQMDELERLTEQWAEDHSRQSTKSENSSLLRC